MNGADFDTLFVYSNACWNQLNAELSLRGDLLAKPFSTTSPYDTLQKLIAHCIGAEERWITRRIAGESLPIVYEDRAADTWEGLFADAKTVRSRTDAFRNGCTEKDYHRLISFPLPPPGTEVFLSVSDILFQILNHENYHRGQIVALLQQNGNDPANFDYVLLKPETRL